MNRLLAGFLFLALAMAAGARDYAKAFPLHLKSRYFEFSYQRQSWDAQGFARFAEGFVDLINRDFIKVDFNYPIRVLVLPDRTTFQGFLRTELGERDPPNFGIYIPRLKLFATYEGSGLGTFAHEIMHPLVEHNLPARPSWAVEAIPSFFEKFFGYYENGSMVVQWGYQNPWRIEALGPRLTRIDLETLVSGKTPRDGYDTSELRLISVFLWQQGKLQQFLRLVAGQKHEGFPTYFESAMGMPLKEIIPRWKKYLEDIQTHRAEVLQIPASEVLADQASFTRFMGAYGLPIAGQSSPTGR